MKIKELIKDLEDLQKTYGDDVKLAIRYDSGIKDLTDILTLYFRTLDEDSEIVETVLLLK